MDFIMTYELEDSLYINMTNQCTNDCTFCVRNLDSGIKKDLDLWLKREPQASEIISDLEKWDLSKYKEVIFCGYGEPMMRTLELVEVAKYIKSVSNIRIRINTNGHANMFYEKDITSLLSNVIDSVSISLNSPNAKEYNTICKPMYGDVAYDGIIDFANKCKVYVPQVTFTVVDIIGKDAIEICRKIASDNGIGFRVREEIVDEQL